MTTPLPATSKAQLREALQAHYSQELWHRVREGLVLSLASLGGLLWLRCAFPGLFNEPSARLLLWVWSFVFLVTLAAGLKEWSWRRRITTTSRRRQ